MDENFVYIFIFLTSFIKSFFYLSKKYSFIFYIEVFA